MCLVPIVTVVLVTAHLECCLQTEETFVPGWFPASDISKADIQAGMGQQVRHCNGFWLIRPFMLGIAALFPNLAEFYPVSINLCPDTCLYTRIQAEEGRGTC